MRGVNILGFLNKSLGGFTIKGFYIETRYWQAIALIFLIFLLVVTFAHLRHVYVGWSFRQAGSMLLIGFLLALILEGFMILSGKTLLIGILGWRSAPKPISTALDEGRSKLIQVLGVTNNDGLPDTQSLMENISKLDPKTVEQLKQSLCD
jgi:hypothetical protein